MIISGRIPMKIITQEIPKRASMCCSCQTPFARGVELLSVLLEVPPFRSDYCTHCAENAPKDTPKWRSRVPQKIKSPYADLKRDERALALFKDLLKDPADRWGEIFILAQYLEREKIFVLRQDGISMQGIPLSIYELVATEEMFRIPRLDPKALPLEKIQETLAHHLKGQTL